MTDHAHAKGLIEKYAHCSPGLAQNGDLYDLILLARYAQALSSSAGPALPVEPTERLIIALESCASKLAQLGREFNNMNFTDRHGDGPICVALAKHARAVLDEVRSRATASPIEKEE